MCHHYSYSAYWVIVHAFLMSADFIQNQHFGKILSEIPSECQTVWIQVQIPNCLQRFEGYINIVLIFFHVLVLQEYWVLTESRIPLKLVLGGVRIVALSSSSREQTSQNRVCCFLIL